jgi:murein DD-endopeptidase MepM/ murein hydrolase activator NlpD
VILRGYDTVIMQFLRRTFNFLYLPEDDSRVRQLHLPGSALAAGILGLLVVLGLAGMHLVGLMDGSSWLPGGSALRQQNLLLAGEVDRLEGQITALRQDLAEVHQLQETVSAAVGLDPTDPNVWEAGVGGRAPAAGGELGPSPEPVQARIEALQAVVAKLARQVRIQYAGYQTLLDTLGDRQDQLDHLPSIRPVDIGYISSGFGQRPDPFTAKLKYHQGLDFSVPVGTPVRATADGVVVVVNQERGFGRTVVIDHGNRMQTLYAHLGKPLVAKGQHVRRGDIIAESGRSGRCTAPHLHYELRVASRRVNPLPYILDSYASR